MESVAAINLEEGVSHLRSLKGLQPFRFGVVSCNFLYHCAIITVALVIVVVLALECKDYVRSLLLWLEGQQHWVTCSLFLVLFTLVAFPFLWGYTFLLVSSGYLFGVLRGLPTVVVTANLGVAIAHSAMRAFGASLPVARLAANSKVSAVLAVISDPRAFKVAVCARLVPIPFGLQNAVFALSSIGTKPYLVASFLGLLPAQVINVYLGSTLRSMEEVLSNKANAITGAVVFLQIAAGVSLMMYVAMKARIELRKALNEDVSSAIAKPLCEV
ncbi:transmembrane protein 64 [Bacillus rossius redtenbacheri]|uniref:transmembrane protein 64 n=1 Tax=Bacillus rossius redtenbacheri TaxID=93214 RepID=UPI002FDD2CD2